MKYNKVFAKQTFSNQTEFVNISDLEIPSQNVNWNDIQGKPTTFAPIIGTTATTALAGNTALLQLGTTGTTASAGNHTHAFTVITGTASVAQIPSLPTSKITTGTFAIAQTNSVLTGLGAGTNEAVVSTDTLLAAIAKLQAQITALQTP